MSDTTSDIIELLLTAQIYNKYPELDVNDLPKSIRKYYWSREQRTVPKPIRVKTLDLEKIFEISKVNGMLNSLPFVSIDDMEFSVKITALDVGADWFQKREGSMDKIAQNPTLAFYYEKKHVQGADYGTAKSKARPKEVDREWIESLIMDIQKEEGGEDMVKLAEISAPEDIRQTLKEFILTPAQEEDVKKIVKAIQYREYLKRIGLYDVGKILMVGPPGTGKTSLAKAMSEHLAIPFVEVRLSMITDQYLGETAKNIDRVFSLAKKLSPCILFIDEFDFIAKTRSSDEHAALKRAVNTLLKAIDGISLTNDGVLLLAATNHPKMLDSAAWRRFDDIMQFPLPDTDMRKKILDIVMKEIQGEFDTHEVASLTHGYSGSDLRMVIRECVLSALMTERMELTQKDLLSAVAKFDERAVLKTNEYDATM
ncbi:ATP-binding protein [Methanolobus sp.]|uniref:ATP-binding protein n=1 Tax=Methanolobus sp. TaxID=1874737 RepID=UPI0025E6498F|nr:ATP-binding protein [Methanolobus sp.]